MKIWFSEMKAKYHTNFTNPGFCYVVLEVVININVLDALYRNQIGPVQTSELILTNIEEILLLHLCFPIESTLYFTVKFSSNSAASPNMFLACLS